MVCLNLLPCILLPQYNSFDRLNWWHTFGWGHKTTSSKVIYLTALTRGVLDSVGKNTLRGGLANKTTDRKSGSQLYMTMYELCMCLCICITKIQGHKIVRCDIGKLCDKLIPGIIFQCVDQKLMNIDARGVSVFLTWIYPKKKNNRQVRERNCFEVRFKKVIALCGNESRVGMLLRIATKMAIHHSGKNSGYSARINMKKYRVPFPSMHAQPPGDCYHTFPLWKTVGQL